MSLCDYAADVAVHAHIGCLAYGVCQAVYGSHIIGVAVVHQRFKCLLVFGVDAQGHYKVFDSAVVVAHHFLDRGTTGINLGIVYIEANGLLEIFVGRAKVVFFYSHACEAQQRLEAAAVEALQALVVGLGFGVHAKFEFGVRPLVYGVVVVGIEHHSRIQVGQSLKVVGCLVIDACPEHVLLEAEVAFGGGCAAQSFVYIGHSAYVFVVSIIFVGAAEPRVIVVGVGFELLFVNTQHSLGYRIVNALLGYRRREYGAGGECQNEFFQHQCGSCQLVLE